MKKLIFVGLVLLVWASYSTASALTPPAIIPLVLPEAMVGQRYSAVLINQAARPNERLSWRVYNGVLPPGLQLGGVFCVDGEVYDCLSLSQIKIHGTPTQAGTFQFWLTTGDPNQGELGSRITLVVRAANVSVTIVELQAQIEHLLEQIRQLQNQQQSLSCSNFSRNLRWGDEGDEVGKLAVFLLREGFQPIPVDSGSSRIDELFTRAIVKFQEKYASEILTPNGLTRGTGFVGPATRAKLNQLYGCESEVFITPTVLPDAKVKVVINNGVSGGNYYKQQLVARGFKSTGNVKWSISTGVLPTGLNLIDPSAYACIPEGPCPAPDLTKTSISGWATSAGTYNFTVQATDGTRTAQQTYTLKVIDAPQITVLTPNGGEQWVSGTVQDITWKVVGNSAIIKVDLYLYRVPGPVTCGNVPIPLCDIAFVQYSLDKNINSHTAYHWIVATDINNQPIPAGNYKVGICEAGSATNCDYSDNYFTIR